VNPAARDIHTRVLIVDDHRMFADSLVRLLDDEADFEVVAVTHSIADAIRAANSTRPDVVLLDFRLPDGDAPACIARLNETTPHAQVLIMTGLDDDATLRTARASGCVVVTKDRAAAELIAALRLVANPDGNSYLTTRVDVTRTGQPALSPRELHLLKELARGLSTTEIAQAMHISPTTVRNHIQRILAKLGAHSRLEAVAIARQQGIIDR